MKSAMTRASLYQFSPRNVALYEARGWKAYYERHWLLTLALLFRLLRSQFGLSVVQAAQATYYSVRAAMEFAPIQHNDLCVQDLLERFYTVLRDVTAASFDPGRAAAAEFVYWDVHRRLSGQKGTPQLIEALTEVAVQVYGVSAERARPAGMARAHACDLVDDITGGRQPSTPEAWAAVEATLRQSYILLRAEIEQSSPGY